MELGKSSGYSFRYFTKDKSLTKAHILHELAAFPDTKFYLPDDVNPKYLTRDYLFSVRYNNINLFII